MVVQEPFLERKPRAAILLHPAGAFDEVGLRSGDKIKTFAAKRGGKKGHLTRFVGRNERVFPS